MADFLLEAKFIDDLNDSLANLTDAEALEKAVDEPFAEYSAECKGWAITGLPPPPEISEDGIVGVAGMAWHPETDYIELKIQQLYIGQKFPGKALPPNSGVQGGFFYHGELRPLEVDQEDGDI